MQEWKKRKNERQADAEKRNRIEKKAIFACLPSCPESSGAVGRQNDKIDERMKYDTSAIRRQDRLLDEDRALFLLGNAEYGVLSLNAGESGAYGIPLNFVWDKKESLYFHCAPAGRKLELAERNNRVSFCVVGPTHVISSKFTTNYESIVLAGTLCTRLPASEKWRALELLLDKYSPADKETGMKYAAGSFRRTAVARLDILSWSGKGKRMQVE